jgi:acyl-CoA reductase-like NAD-dependent aldehyde dehydrogenase
MEDSLPRSGPFEPGPVLTNLIGGRSLPAAASSLGRRHSPHDGRLLWEFPESDEALVDRAVSAARAAAGVWGWQMAAPARGDLLLTLAGLMASHARDLAAVVAAETGKAPGEAEGEVMGAVALGRFFAGEGTRLFGRTMPSAVAGKRAMTIREPVGVAALIAASNTPAANISWKLFPALVSGNTVVIKAAESTPGTAWMMGELCRSAGIPDGVVNVIHGHRDTGRLLVAHPAVDVVSFTGSTVAGRDIAEVCARRLARVSLELGGKNALVVLDDADLERAVDWAVRSAFSNAGQRCASGSRLIVTEGIHDRFVERFVERTKELRVGPTDDDDLGPVITEAALLRIAEEVEAAIADGQQLLAGGSRLTGPAHVRGNYFAPTVIAMSDHGHALSERELFGPVAQVYRVRDAEHALELVNDSPYGLTAAIHTRDYGRAMDFVRLASVGVVAVNAGTYGSEPHMPFGGRRASGNGTREPGTESLDVYTSLKTAYLWPDEAGG